MYQQRQHPEHTACRQNPQIWIFAILFQEVLRLVQQHTEQNAHRRTANAQQQNFQRRHHLKRRNFPDRILRQRNAAFARQPRSRQRSNGTGHQCRIPHGTDTHHFHGENRCRNGRAENCRKRRRHAAEHQHLFIPFRQTEHPSQHTAHTAAQLQRRTFPSGTAAAEVGHYGGNENQRCHLHRQFRFCPQRSQHHIGALVVLVVTDAVQPHDQQTAGGKSQHCPPMPRPECRHPLYGIHKSNPDKSHQNAHQHRVKYPPQQQPQMGKNVDTAVQQPSFPVGKKTFP